MQQRFNNGLQELFLQDGGAILVAVSGGPDSMCMAELFRRSGFPFAVAHCNFRLRGEESDADEALVSGWCGEAGVKCHVTSFDTEAYAKEKGMSIEMAARELRYRRFGELCKEYSYQAVAVAHNANDNAETLILNLLRGTGLRGICGMEELGKLPVEEYSDISLFRPLLGFSREEILAFNKENSVPSREDASNSDTIYRRNKIRHGVFPIFREINPSFLEVLGRDMEHFAQASKALDLLYHSWLNDNAEGEDVLKVEMDVLRNTPFRDYFLFRLMDVHGFNSSVTDSVNTLLDSDGTRSGKTFISGDYTLVTTSSALVFMENKGEESVEDLIISLPGEYTLGGDSFRVEVIPNTPGLELKTAGCSFFDSASLTFPFIVRRPRPGDWLVPYGMKGGRKKLSNLFVDLKFSLADKAHALIASPAGEGSRIAALAGYRIDDRYKVKPNAVSIIKIQIDRNN